ncbi:MAG TPA: hypothetical protein VMR52_09765 [Dehalococcoidia bacterium]|nr:hypothetical protein [Dehalococcoidia bacterium]
MTKTSLIEKKRPRAKAEETPQAEAVATSDEPTCQHHWVIAAPQGAMSQGRCKRCGEEREFRNSTTDYVWDDDSKAKGYTPWRGTRTAPKMIESSDGMAAAGASREAAA